MSSIYWRWIASYQSHYSTHNSGTLRARFVYWRQINYPRTSIIIFRSYNNFSKRLRTSAQAANSLFPLSTTLYDHEKRQSNSAHSHPLTAERSATVRTLAPFWVNSMAEPKCPGTAIAVRHALKEADPRTSPTPQYLFRHFSLIANRQQESKQGRTSYQYTPAKEGSEECGHHSSEPPSTGSKVLSLQGIL